METLIINTEFESKKPCVYVIEGYRKQAQERYKYNRNIRSHVWQPPTDVYEFEGSIFVRVEIAGLQENDISLVLDGKYLMIKGNRADKSEGRGYHQMEIRFGEFLSEVDLPHHVDVDNVSAIYINGFLIIELPPQKPSRVIVNIE